MKYSIVKRLLVCFGGTVACGGLLMLAWPKERADAKPLPIKGQIVTAEQANDRTWRERRDRALESCYANGGIPTLGFSFNVVCIEGCVREFDPASGKRREARGYAENCP